jgi:hypothetical protein
MEGLNLISRLLKCTTQFYAHCHRTETLAGSSFVKQALLFIPWSILKTQFMLNDFHYFQPVWDIKVLCHQQKEKCYTGSTKIPESSHNLNVTKVRSQMQGKVVKETRSKSPIFKKGRACLLK